MEEFLKAQNTTFFWDGTEMLEYYLIKCIDVKGEYGENLWKTVSLHWYLLSES